MKHADGNNSSSAENCDTMTQKYLKKPEDIRTREQIHQNAILPLC